MLAALLGAALLVGCGGAQKEALRREAKTTYTLGLASLSEGRPTEALRQLSQAEALTPDDTDVLYALGLAYWRKREYALAEAKFRRAVELKPDFSEVWNNLGAMAIDQQDYAGAVRPLETALQNVFYQTREHALTNLGLALFKLGRPAEAEQRLREATDVAPGFPLARKMLGMVLQGQGRDREALEELDQAARLLPQGALLHRAEVELHRGLSLWKLGDREAARGAFDEAWRLAPGNDIGRSAKNYLDRLD